MRRRVTRAAAIVLPFLCACAPATDRDPPSLVVIITLDQFRASYLREYDAVFTRGFRRFVDEGHRFDRAQVDHAPTLSLPGHATVATGSHPRTHGFNANDWLVTSPDGSRRRELVFSDTSVQTVGSTEGGFSARNLRVTGVADWIRARDPRAHAVALSTGTGLAAVYGGHPLADESRNHAYWLSERTGTFVTSTYFRTSLPDWVAAFNDTVIPQLHADSVWRLAVPAAHRERARDDAASFEGDGVHTTFPHRFADVLGGERNTIAPEHRQALFGRWFSNSPLGDAALFTLAQEAVVRLALGQRGVTDFLSIAVKSTDRQGHDYGPRSLEQLDVLYRLDGLIGDLLDYLDRTVGRGRYVAVLTADHGAPNVAEFELQEGRPARRVTQEDIQTVLDDVDRVVRAHRGPETAIPNLVARRLEQADFILRAMTPAELADTGPADQTLYAYRNTYIPGRATTFPLWTDEVLSGQVGATHPANWGIVVELDPHAQIYTARSAHGSAHSYDREVPLIFLGAGITPLLDTVPARTIDIAPTLARLVDVTPPPTVDGTVLELR
jgi:hypothetical protein